jgi:dUTP pyrophosphatase
MRTVFYSGKAALTRGSADAAGWDLRSDDTYVLPQFKVVMVGTGIRLIIPAGHEGQIRPRSSLGKQGIIIPNAPGTIDADYRGEIKVIMMNLLEEEFVIEAGERIAQIVFAPVLDVAMQGVEMTEIVANSTIRGDGGFGSTGR